MSETNEKIGKLQSLFDDIGNWQQSAVNAGLKVDELVVKITNEIKKEINRETILIHKAKIAELKKGVK